MKPRTRMKNLVTSFLASDLLRTGKHLVGRWKRRGEPEVHYFHQVDDPYSHLAAQKLEELQSRYRVTFRNHLVGPPATDAQGDSSRFRSWALRDARSVSAYYGTSLPDHVDEVPATEAAKAAGYLSGFLASPAFAREAVATGERLWSGERLPTSGNSDTSSLDDGNQLREALGHYLSATFYFEGEWYWGVDRLMHLEDRLCNMGLSNNPSSICVPRPLPPALGERDASGVRLEYFPSLRSPYTAISFDRTMKMAERTGVELNLRPVMPMVMRGVPLPRAKALYIVQDTKREANYYGEPFGNIVDPIGEPVRRAFSLYPYIASRGKGAAYCGAYLTASWVNGVDVTTDAGLRSVVESCGIPWDEAAEHLGTSEWQALLDANVNEMLAAGLWGVPSFRVSGENMAGDFCCWGQDRLWRVEAEIVNRAK